MSDTEKEILNYLSESGCCRICCVRYLGYKKVDFNNTTSYLHKKEFWEETSDSNEITIKKSKQNPCAVCLGLLENHILEEIVNVVTNSNVTEYDCKYFTCSVSMPASILTREHSIKTHLKDRFPSYFADTEEVALNKAWKWLIKSPISLNINKEFENSDTCNFSINIIMEYEDDATELQQLKKLLPEGTKIKNSTFSSRKSVSNILTNTEMNSFRKCIPVPPDIPSNYIKCKSVMCSHSPIYVAGRYCKYSRDLSQSPWIIDGVKNMDTSVQELIFDEMARTLRISIESLKFTASGREDCDVRCLGKGRPFYIEINDPKVTHYNNSEFVQLQTNIKKLKLISVRDLQLVEKSDLRRVKEGEQLKTKQYVALCITKTPVNEELLNKINDLKQLTIEQKTPIRVLHRRPLAVRRKKIIEMHATAVPGRDHLFELKLVTEAGTYVKEFVHSDFERTKPSIKGILKMDVDIIALDVIAIDLDWPKEITDFNCDE